MRVIRDIVGEEKERSFMRERGKRGRGGTRTLRGAVRKEKRERGNERQEGEGMKAQLARLEGKNGSQELQERRNKEKRTRGRERKRAKV